MAKARIRQRVLGAAVILSLGFIAYSILIQSSSNSYIDRSAQIPAQTNYIEPLGFEEPRSADVPVEVANPEEMFIADTPVDSAEIQSSPVLDEEGLPNAWAIKVGSFSTLERAIEIRDQLVSHGYKAYFRRIPGAEQTEALFRVTVGPYVDAAEMAQHQSEINAVLDLETVSMDFEQ